MNTGIYKILNTQNGKIYIGSTSSKGGFKKRWNEHKSGLRNGCHPNKHLQNAWIKYGEQSFVFEILEELAVKDVLIREQFYLDNLKPEYNICLIAGNTKGRKLSHFQRQILSEVAKQRIGDKNPFFNKKHSEETKKIQSEKRKEYFLKNEHPLKGKSLPQKQKDLLSKAMLGNIPVNRIKVIQLDKNDQTIKVWESITDAAKNLNLHDGNIVSVCKGKLKTSGGFKWKYQ